MPHFGGFPDVQPNSFFMEENTNTPSDNYATNLIKQFIVSHYQPAKDYVSAKVKLSTAQLHLKLIAMHPDADISPSGLYCFMRDQGFAEIEIRPFETEWLLDRK